MKLIDDLHAEHHLIERVLGSMRTYFDLLLHDAAPVDDAAKFIHFFKTYAGGFHHEREEQILFPALVNEADVPGDRGPVLVLNEDHHTMEAMMEDMRLIVADGDFSNFHRAALRGLAIRYSHELWHHIDAEDHVFLPESEVRLRRHGVPELASREPNEAERAAAAVGEQLASRYAQLDDREVVRGEGCMMCPAYAERCRGIEREWWNQWEWEEMEGHLGAD